MQFRRILLALTAASLISLTALAQTPAAPAKPHAKAHATKTVKAAQPTLAEQVQALRDQLDKQAAAIQQLSQGLAAKDAQLEKAQKLAAQAQAEAARTAAQLNGQQQAATENSAAVATLQSTVNDLKSNSANLAATISTETASLKKSIDSPSNFHFKGITMTPYGFLNGELVARAHATGAGMPTPFSALPYEHADAYSLTETIISGQQSRIGVNFEGKSSVGTIRGYLEGDFLGAGTTSNNNQSNSYMFRQRILLGEIETKSHWIFSGGQGWTLAAENRKGINTAAASIALPMQIDPNYVTGLVWSRGGGFRVTKLFPKVAIAAAIENPQVLYTASIAGNTPYAVLGSAGNSGGLYNATISGCSPATSIVNYTNQNDGTSNVALPVYKTVNSCANMANISFNQAPDVLAKVAFDPGIGHYEVFGIARFAHETVYPGETTNSNLYGGLKDVTTGLVVAPALTSAGAYSSDIKLGGLGGSARVPLFKDKLILGAKGLFGAGVGRYGDSTLSDTTANAAGELRPLHNASGLLTLEVNPNPRLALYAYYGGDYVGRSDYGSDATTTLAAPSATFCVNGVCTAAPATTASGTWGAHWAAPATAAVGYGSRLLSNSACLTNANPGYNGSSTGYYPGGSCGAQTRNVQEATGGYWYDIYKGPAGRFRQGIQYGYAVREGWSGASGIGAKGVENMFFTSFRYFLP